jgi:hypothetical protein
MKTCLWIIAFLMSIASVCPMQTEAQTSAPTTANATMPSDNQSHLTLDVSPLSGAVYPSMRPAVQIVVKLNGSAVADEIIAIEAKGWDCTSPKSYTVISKDGSKRLPVEAVLPNGKGSSCKNTTPDPVILQISSAVNADIEYVVTLNGTSSDKVVRSDAFKFPKGTSSSFSAIPQAVPSEKMNDGTTRDVGQLNFSYGIPFIGKSPVSFSTKNVFSTNAEDAKSSWATTIGVSHGLFPAWYVPIQLSETMQGNQSASNVSAVTSLSVSGLIPWYWSRKILNNDGINWGLSPEFALNSAYTRRIEQSVTAETSRLEDNDLSINPLLTIEPFYLLPSLCSTYQKWLGAEKSSRQFCVGLQSDLGLYYLPLDKTKTGSQMVEGYGSVSILIPLSNLNFKDFQLVKADGLLNSQIHIKWSDSVNAANNYARTRQWTFGIEVMK